MSFGSWTSSGSHDIFSEVVYVCSFEKSIQEFHLALVSMHGTDLLSVACQLRRNLQRFGIEKRCIGYVYDSASNMSAGESAFVGSVICDLLGLLKSPQTGCWSSVLRAALSKGISPIEKLDNDLSSIYFSVKKKLQSCFTWTKKAVRGLKGDR